MEESRGAGGDTHAWPSLLPIVRMHHVHACTAVERCAVGGWLCNGRVVITFITVMRDLQCCIANPLQGEPGPVRPSTCLPANQPRRAGATRVGIRTGGWSDGRADR